LKTDLPGVESEDQIDQRPIAMEELAVLQERPKR